MRKLLGKSKVLPKLGKFWFNQIYVDDYSFIHINKCGGTSVEKYLGIHRVHDTASQRIKKIGLGRWNKRFTFAIVRHPYAKVVSHYNYRVKTNQTNLGSSPIDINEWVKRSYGEKDIQFYNKPLMFAPCYDWLSVDEKIVVDKVIKLEELNSRWKEICHDLHVPFKPLPVQNKTNMGSNNGALKLLDAESIRIIDAHFEKDFAAFGYDKSEILQAS